LTKKELTAEKIKEVLPQVLAEHEKNAQEIEYLYNYYKGKQPILSKKKVVRPEINNKIVENHAFEIVEFKKAYVYGEPVQYVQKGKTENNTANPEILELNEYMECEDKATLDKELAEWQYIAGTAYRWVDVNKDGDGETPFTMSVPDPRRTFVVYSSGIKGEPLFSGHYSYFTENVQTDEKLSYLNKYRIITIYTDDFECQIKENMGDYQVLQQEIHIGEQSEQITEYPLLIKGNRIVEYPLNTSRLGLIELVITGLNAINRIKSADLDDVEQFVQSLLVFINQDVNAEDVVELMQLGAVKINSADPQKPADIKLLAQQLAHSDTKNMAEDLYNKILTICGVPRMNEKSSGGDTGQARMLGEGWSLADQRAKQDELSFKKAERQFLKLILNICSHQSKLGDLKLKDIEIKFTRNKSDNLLTKTQGLMNMMSAQVSPDVAFATCGLFSDPNDVFDKSIQYFGKDFWKAGKNQNGNQPQKAEVDNGINNAKQETEPKKNISTDEGE